MKKNVIKKAIIVVFVISVLSCLLPFTYFMFFPADDSTRKEILMLPKDIVAEYCFNYWKSPDHLVNVDFRLGRPGVFAFGIPSGHFTRCGYIPWLPLLSLPDANVGYKYFKFPPP
jgi:hypothetical protein